MDVLASEYGWSIREISKLTYREINYLTAQISKRTHNNYVFHANIHGIKMKPIDSIDPIETQKTMAPEQNEKAWKAMDRMINRLRDKRGRK